MPFVKKSPPQCALSRILSGIPRAAQAVLGVYLKRTCSRDTSTSSALGVLNDNALYKPTHARTHALGRKRNRIRTLIDRRSKLLAAGFLSAALSLILRPLLASETRSDTVDWAENEEETDVDKRQDKDGETRR